MNNRSSYNPDVLSCIANLSNDEVFTPPQLANQMIDHLPSELWSDPDAKFLDPCSKSGVFLREIVKRLDQGLEHHIPDRRSRLDHILGKQVFALATTELTSLLSRRSIYCSKTANGKFSITAVFDDESGNVKFNAMKHTWEGSRCIYCGASKANLDRAEGLESHAYEFIHTQNPETLFNMKFDVVIGNPPYQLSDGGHNKSASPIYQKFVEQAIKLDPRYVVMITPSRWFTGGKGLDQFRDKMLKEHRLRNLVDYPKLYDGFPGVKIRGGVSYFLWDRNYDGECTVQTMWDGKPTGMPVARRLDAYDVLVRRNEAVPILEKIRAFGEDKIAEPTLFDRVSSSKPFGLRTNFHGKSTKKGIKDPVKLYGSQRISWVERSAIPQNPDWIDRWKVLMSAVQGTSAAIETKFLSNPIVEGPGVACTETYVVAGNFDNEVQAERYAAYLRTRFVRFLVSLRKAAQHATRHVYAFVPDVPLDQDWTDRKLYDRYSLTDDEVAFIESIVKPMDAKE